jgi:uncharacterized membrane-anchored protein
VRRWLFAAGFMILVAGPIVKFWSDDIGSGIILFGLLVIAVGVVWWAVDKLRKKK